MSKAHVGQNRIRPLRVDRVAKIKNNITSLRGSPLRRRNPDLPANPFGNLAVKLPKGSGMGIEDGEELVAVELKERRGIVGRGYGALELHNPRRGILHLDFRDRAP